MWDNRDITKFNIYFMQKKSKTIKLFEDIISLCCLLRISLSTLTVGFRGRIYIIMFAAEYSLSASPNINWLWRCHTSWRDVKTRSWSFQWPFYILLQKCIIEKVVLSQHWTLANTQTVNDSDSFLQFPVVSRPNWYSKCILHSFILSTLPNLMKSDITLLWRIFEGYLFKPSRY